mmetsp:Transcript_12977/g.37287  ORF Transcript_12977/g.37287 Transcript_12977/m.37287 type:complete len:306 (+) Transcript_12977:110-1027(+)
MERRVVLASDALGSCAEDDVRRLLTISDPATGHPAQYLAIIPAPPAPSAPSECVPSPSIHELNVFRPSACASTAYSAWFGPGDAVVRDGNLYLFTPVHINFLILPALMKIQKENPANFCGLDHVVETMECDQLAFGILLDVLKHSTQLERINSICDVKENAGDVFVKLNDDKLVSWLKSRVERVTAKIREGDKGFEGFAQGGEEMTRYGIGVVSEYIAEDVESRLYAGFGIEKRVETPAKADGPLDMPKVVSEEDRASRREEMEGRRKQQAKDKAKAQREEDKARKRAKEVEGIPKISSFFKRKK